MRVIEAPCPSAFWALLRALLCYAWRCAHGSPDTVGIACSSCSVSAHIMHCAQWLCKPVHLECSLCMHVAVIDSAGQLSTSQPPSPETSEHSLFMFKCYTWNTKMQGDRCCRRLSQRPKASGGGGSSCVPLVSSSWMSTRYSTCGRHAAASSVHTLHAILGGCMEQRHHSRYSPHKQGHRWHHDLGAPQR